MIRSDLIETAFQRLHNRLPTDADRLRLYQVRDALALEPDDTLWNVILALDYHVTLYETIPERIQTLSNTLIAACNTMTSEIGAGQDRIITDMASRLETAAQSGVMQGFSESSKDLAELLAFLREGPAREKVMAPIRSDAASCVRELTSTAKTEVERLRDDAKNILANAVPQIAVPWSIIGALGALVLAMILGITLSSRIYAEGRVGGIRERILLERAFYQGLDPTGRASFTRHNMNLPRESRLTQ